MSDSDTQTVEHAGMKFQIHRKYRIQKIIGKGAFGVVVSAEDTETGRKVAIKKIINPTADPIDAKRVLREVKLMRHFNHENVVRLLDMEPPGTGGFSDIYLVTELMQTDLSKVISSRQALSEQHVQYFMYQILKALKYIHSASVFHRDLKPSNIVVNANCDLKICDFGLARGLDDAIDSPPYTAYVVTRWYRAPEIMLCLKKYTTAVDLWAAGCIFGELLSRKPMFPGADYLEQLQLIVECIGTPSDDDLDFVTSDRALAFIKRQRGNPLSSLQVKYKKHGDVALDLLQRLLALHPGKRITAEEALEHPYFAEFHNVDYEPTCPRMFDFTFERDELDLAAIQRLLALEQAAIRRKKCPLLSPAVSMCGSGGTVPYGSDSPVAAAHVKRPVARRPDKA